MLPLSDDMSGPPRKEFSKAPNFNILFMVYLTSFPVYTLIQVNSIVCFEASTASLLLTNKQFTLVLSLNFCFGIK
jgi:hypothetical protein